MAAITNRKTTSSGNKVEWLKIHWIRVLKEKPFVMFFKYTVDDEVPFMEVSLMKRGRKAA